jgi:O-antigen biosynthesis protein WbqP
MKMVCTPYLCVKRFLDICIVLCVGVVLLLPSLAVALVVAITSNGPVIYWSQRVGKDKHLFLMPKFRTMRVDTPQLATHLVVDPQRYLTPVGGFLRRSSLDELPQLWSILMGDMTLVGPRPALFNQDDLMALRAAHGIHRQTPGLTGWAQVNGRDEIPIPAKVAFEAEYLKRQSLGFDIYILLLTAKKVLLRKNVSH